MNDRFVDHPINRRPAKINELMTQNNSMSQYLSKISEQIKETESKIKFEEQEFIKQKSRLEKEILDIQTFENFKDSQNQILNLNTSIVSKKKQYEKQLEYFQKKDAGTFSKECLNYKDYFQENSKLLGMCLEKLNKYK